MQQDQQVTDNPTAGASAHLTSQQPSLRSLLREHRDYRLLWLGTLGTQSGQWALQVAIGWLMLDITDSDFWVGLAGFAGGLPMLLLAVPAGIITDRFNRRSVLIVCQAGLCLMGTLLALIVFADHGSRWWLLAAAALNGGLMTINNTARQAMVPATVERSRLQSAIALNAAGQNSTRIAGPSLAGVCIAVAGVGAAFAFQAGLLAVALVMTVMLSSAVASGVATTTAGRALDGLRIVWHSRQLRDLMLITAIPTFFVFPYLQLLPVFARDILMIGPQGLGILLASSGLGTVIGALLIAGTPQLRHPGRFMIVATLVYCIVVMAFALSSWVWLSIPFLVLAGISGAAFLSVNSTLIQLTVDDAVRGRVIGVSMLTWGLMPLGSLPVGIAAERWGAPAAIVGGAIISILLTLWLAASSPLVRLR